MVIISFVTENKEEVIDHFKERVDLTKAYIEPEINKSLFADRIVYLITAKDYHMPRVSAFLFFMAMFGFVASWLFGSQIGFFNTLLIIMALVFVGIMIIETLVRTPSFSYFLLKAALNKNGYTGKIRRLNAAEGINAAVHNIRPLFKDEIKEVGKYGAI
jgi:hypothetical protein